MIVRTLFVAGLLATALALTVGCQSVHWSKADVPFKSSPFTKKKKDEPVTPARMSVIWTPTVMPGPNQTPKSGFGGQVYFFDAEGRPVRVSGEMVVYGFDDSNDRHSRQADHKYVFKQERLNDHFSETPVGPAYSFWVPWQDADGPRKQIALMPVFKAVDGTIIKGDQSINVLPGSPPPSDMTKHPSGIAPAQALAAGNAERSQVAPIGTRFQEPSPTTGRTMRTTTIDVPRSNNVQSPANEETLNGLPFGVISTQNTQRTMGPAATTK